MKRFIVLFLLAFTVSCGAKKKAVKESKVKIVENSIVKDSTVQIVITDILTDSFSGDIIPIDETLPVKVEIDGITTIFHNAKKVNFDFSKKKEIVVDSTASTVSKIQEKVVDVVKKEKDIKIIRPNIAIVIFIIIIAIVAGYFYLRKKMII